ncbi:DUF1302 family protein [Sphaerotilus sp.]|uniref:DUF1302 domain-containing protein n=1 Tax=Sphaerotilus sp. TaxID=2093942 RepID=UPI00286E2D43|nr:DUF1302 family protein [Sphaerotilus sp.]
MKKHPIRPCVPVRTRRLPVALATLACLASSAHAFELDLDNPDLRARLDNTFKWSGAARLKSADATLLSSPNHDDGDRNFGKGVISNRLDWLSEFDVTYQRNLGLRLSAAAFYDDAYHRSNDNPGFAGGAFPNQGSVAANQFTKETRAVHGNKAELLDAFVFGKTELGDSTLSGRLGRHGLLWGESLFFGANAIAGGQMPVDIVKLLSVPNTQFKEAIRPVPQVSGHLQISPDVSVSAYYQFRWAKSVAPAVGSYFSNVDVAVDGAESLLLPSPLSPALRQTDSQPKNSGQGGLQFKVRAADTDFGFYAIRFHNKTPQVVPVVGFIVPPPTPVVAPLGFTHTYQSGITAFGASASRTIGDYNLAVEASIRHRQDLASTQGANASALGGPALGYAIGNTAHVNLSTLATLPGNLLWNEASLLGEIAWNRVLHVTENAAAVDPNATRDAVALRLQLEPTYRQVLPGLDVGVPVGLGWAPHGSRSMALGPLAMPSDGGGDISLGLNGTYLDAWRFSLSLTHYFGTVGTFQSGANNAYTYKQTLKDRDYVALSVRRTF